VATTESDKYGSFSFEGVQPGAYWLRVQKNQLIRLIPVRVTNGFDEKGLIVPSTVEKHSEESLSAHPLKGAECWKQRNADSI
jgi:hypothetical protein